MNFGMIQLNQIIKTKQNCLAQILAALLFILKLKIFTKILLMMLKDGLIHLTMTRMMKDRFQQARIKKMNKDELGRKIMTEFVALRSRIWAYLMHGDSEHKKAKGTKKCVIKQRLMIKNYKDCLFNDKTIIKSQQRFKSDCHNVYTE